MVCCSGQVFTIVANMVKNGVTHSISYFQNFKKILTQCESLTRMYYSLALSLAEALKRKLR